MCIRDRADTVYCYSGFSVLEYDRGREYIWNTKERPRLATCMDACSKSALTHGD